MAKDELVAGLPDVFGHVVFCDDIRIENTNKLIAVGMYMTDLRVFGDFPAQIKSFAMLIHFSERIGSRDSPVKIEIHFPGEEEPIVQIDLPDQFRSMPLSEGDPDFYDSSFFHAAMPVIMGPIIFKKRGMIRVVAKVGEERIRLGALRIDRAPTVAPTQPVGPGPKSTEAAN